LKDSLQMLLVAGVIVFFGLVTYLQIFESNSENSFRIHAVEGEVTHRVGDLEAPAVVGELLGENDRLQTGEGGRVELTLGEHTQMALDGDSSLVLVGADAEGLRVELEGGRVQATVRPGGAQLSVVAGAREVIASQASFTVGVGAGGTTAVESRAGTVTLIGFGELSALEEGQQILAVAGREPQLAAIPKSLLLEVEWPSETTREAESRLVGNTEPGAVIWTDVNGKRLKTVADSQGRFVLDGVPLDQGRNTILVSGQSLLGGEGTLEGNLERDSKAPIGAFEVQY
jgi:hypothetical protein